MCLQKLANSVDFTQVLSKINNQAKTGEKKIMGIRVYTERIKVTERGNQSDCLFELFKFSGFISMKTQIGDIGVESD